ncbi:hypothetical protein GCM10007940_31240 [Portibacter lacus]|uniref:Uncharacterized protein n=1 Tax=Portibacter lacus TaxID=1099794 RepID=A0AA37WF59_9BACT|nr:hypothetical protein GCM10007940_31240 [Portibacter lacus]
MSKLAWKPEYKLMIEEGDKPMANFGKEVEFCAFKLIVDKLAIKITIRMN